MTSSISTMKMTSSSNNKKSLCAISSSVVSNVVMFTSMIMMFVLVVLAITSSSSSSNSNNNLFFFVSATDPDICTSGCPAGYFYTNCSQGCSQCSAGYYCTGAKDAPVACSAGTYSSAVGASGAGTCQNCGEGTYSDVDGSTSCKACSSIERSGAGVTSCTACAVGERGTLNVCTACPAGTWINSTVGACVPCSAGYACPTQDRDKETICGPGTYSYEGEGVCTTCQAGFACPATAGCGLETARNKYACQPGTYADAGATTCSSCPAGQYCPNTTISTPIACPSGTYSLGGMTQCAMCPDGHECSDPAVPPVKCADGSYSNTMACLPCPVGSGCTNGLRQLCDLGTYADAPSSTSCSVCPAGSECPTTSAAPSPCGSGFFSEAGSISCTSCSNTNGLAVYQSGSGASQCAICPAGSSCADPANAPVPCAAGTFSREGQATCTSCQSLTVVGSVMGYYSVGTGNSQCTQCPAGSSCNDPAVAPVPCVTGYYSIEGQLSCSICPAGFSCNNPAVNPVPCSEGSFSNDGYTNCTICPVNFYCPSQATNPTQCPLGFFSGEGQGFCFQCPDGSTCAANGTNISNAVFTPCANGTYKTAYETECTLCPAGFYCPFTDLRPIACPFGYYSAQGWMNCSTCPAGTSCPNATTLFPCQPGFYSREADGSCTPCAPGFYCPAADGLPIRCPLGTFAGAGEPSCTPCPAGWACPSTSRFLDVAYPCANGTYSIGNQTSCTVCRPGFACPFTNNNVEEACAPGEYSKRGSTSCEVCRAGFACPFTNGDRYSPIRCRPGFYSLGNSTTCTECLAGFECPFTINNTQTPCQNGTFSFAGQPHCTICSAGYYCPLNSVPDSYALFGQLGFAAQVPCAPGQYSPQGSFACQNCPTGFYCTSQVAADGGRNVCPNGYFTAQGTTYVTIDATNCAQCPAGVDCSVATSAPTACIPGTYVTDAGCFVCPAGFQCPNPGLTPTPCPAGTYSIGNATSCTNCDPGYLCDPKSTSATPAGTECPLGGYCPAGATAVTLCPAGFYGAITRGTSAADSCVACSTGNFCPAGTAGPEGMKTCPEGHYCPEEACCPIPCPGGSYSGALGAMTRATCQPCPEGFFCPPGSSSFSGHACPPGFFCPTGTASGMENGCPPGTYASEHRLSSASQCTQCPAGHKCPSSGLADPLPCETGEFQSQTGSTVCLACEAGWACPTVGNTESYATPCSVGHYCPRGTSDPRSFPCPGGSYTFRTNLRSAGECEVCWRGFHCPRGTGYVPAFPQPCAQGHYCPGAERRPVGRPLFSSAYQGQTASFAVQYPCPPGTLSLAIDIWAASQCAQCPAGSWCAGALTVVSGPCDAGYYCPRGTSTAQGVPCPAGTYNAGTGSAAVTDCTACSAGNYCPQASIGETPCPAGSYFSQTGATAPGPITDTFGTQCIVCPAGFRCASGVTAPTPCAAGTFSFLGDSSCTSCNAGTYCPVSNVAADQATRLFLCPPGLYCPGGMSTYPNADVNPCPAGQYCPLGATVPIDCPIGTYSPFRGRGSVDECLPCPKGFYCATQGLTEPTGECQPGYYCPEASNSATQFPCPVRYYRNKPRAESEEFCAVCPRGYFCPEGTASPILCPTGYYCITGTDQPQPCPIGAFGNTTGLRDQDECSACTAGFYCDGIGLSSPTGLCDPGYYCVSRSSTSAPPGLPMGGLCPKGGYCPPGSSFPTACAEGTFNNYTGGSSQLDCVPCLPGFYCSGSNLPFPSGPCSPGYYCTGGAALPTQFRTPAGHFTGFGAANPIECPIATFNPSPEQSECLVCESGYYCPTRAMITIIPCPPGGYCPSGTGLPRACPRGSYQPFRFRQNVTDCIACDPGKYCDRLNATTITGNCQAGFYCKKGCVDAYCGFYLLNGGVARNLLDTSVTENSIGGACPAGAWCPGATAVPELCPQGTYRDAIQGTSRLDCSPCMPGFYCPSDGSSTLFSGNLLPQRCRAGYYCPGTFPGTNPPYGCITAICAAFRNESCTLNLNGCSPTTNQDLGDGNPSVRLCPTGFYCPEGVDHPMMCPILPDGRTTYQPDRGQTSCLMCPRGRRCYQSDPLTLMSPAACIAGYYCPLGTGVVAQPCPAGSWSDRLDLENKTDCSLCPAGRYCPYHAIDKVSTADMPFCFGGYYCSAGAVNGFGLRGTLGGLGGICPEGHYCPNGTKFNNSFPCAPGTYKNTLGGADASTCLDCTPGYYCFGSGNTATTGPCDAGYYCPIGCSDSQCTNKRCFNGILPPPGGVLDGGLCPQGHFCPPQSSFPQACPNGTFQDLPGQSDCKDCPAGFHCGTATIVPVECGRGRYCPVNTSSFNVPECPPGSVNPARFSTQLSDCQRCPAGRYCPNWGMNNTNLLCESGYYCVDGAAFPNGTVGPLGGSGDVCPSGHYCLNGTRYGTEYPCPAGFYNPTVLGNNFSACLQCEPGFYCNGTGLSAVAGPCDAGFYCPIQCEDSTCSNAACSGNCPMPYAEGGLCPSGHYCPQRVVGSVLTGSIYPTPCPAGSYSPVPGSAICLSCPNGQWCGVNTTNPNECPAGYYCAQGTRYPNQYPCPRGTFAPNVNNTNVTLCQLCSPGQYCEGLGNAAPTGFCFGGYFCSLGASTPYGITGDRGGIAGICPSGHYCPNGTESQYQFPCSNGTYNALPQQRGPEACTFCDPGMYCATEGLSAPTDRCLGGYYCPRNCTDATCSNMPCLTNLADPWLSPYLDGGLCPKGYRCPQTPTRGAIFPIACLEGTYQPATGQTNCTDCPAGFFCPTNTSEPFPCPSGSYCGNSTGFTIPKCPPGTYSPNNTQTSLSNCALCPAGRYCLSDGLDTPTALCSPGYYCASGAAYANGTVNPIYGGDAGPCPYGHFCEAGTESATQNACAAGSYNPIMMGTSNASCLSCTPGFYCGTTGLANVSANCEAGYFCTSGCTDAQCTNKCVGNCTLSSGGGPCPLGYECPLGTLGTAIPTVLNGTTTVRGAILPSPCPAGTYSPSEGSIACQECPAGYYCPIGSSAPQPIICPAGDYCPPGTGNIRPRCPAGTYSDRTGINSTDGCYLCPGGSYCVSDGLTAPSALCAAGYFCPGGASTQLGKPGILGVLGSEWGLDINNHSICPAGFFCEAGAVHPTPCPAGTFNPVSGGTNQTGACNLCTGGSYCAVTNLTAVSGTCLAGHACPTGCVDDRCYSLADAVNTTTPGFVHGDCPAGFFCPLGTSTPNACPNGTFAATPNTVVCDTCPSGLFCGTGTVTPGACPQGSYCPANTTLPLPCPAGSYGATVNLTDINQCTQCDAGMACTITELTAPNFNCSAGYYCTIGAASPDGTPGATLGGTGGICPSGNYCPTSTAVPLQCWNGTYNPDQQTTNASACVPCQPGSYCNGTALSAVTGPCDPGFTCGGGDTAPNDPANLCPAGNYCVQGTSVPAQCSAGFYNPMNGSTSSAACLSCSPGFYCLTASVQPTGPCDAGFYCPGGNTVAAPPATQCQPKFYCPAGSFAPVNCTPGSYCATPQLTEPTGFCDPGFFCTLGAQVSNPTDGVTGDTCPAGAYCPTNTTAPQLCPSGTFNSATGQSSILNCQLCSAGRYCASTGLAAPTNLCDPGFYCPSGMAVPNPANFTCTVGHFCMPGASEPVPCPPGTHQDREGQSSCKPCPSGYFCAGYDNVTDPVICPAGYYCINGTKFGNQWPCPAGTFSNKTGLMAQAQCTSCTPGFYCPNPGQTEAVDLCDAGHFCNGSASISNPTADSTGDLCPIGKYCENGTHIPTDCPPGTYNVVRGLRAVEECQKCTPGFYCGAPGLTTPTGNCSAGYYCPAGETVSNRNICPWGQYCPEQSSLFRRCPSGTFQIDEGKSDCMSCPEGFYCESTAPCNRYASGLSGCVNNNYTCPRPCPLGYYCLAGTRNRHQYPCPMGFFGETTQLTASNNCTACPAGQYCPVSGVSAASGLLCSPGYWCKGGATVPNPTDGTTGELCPAGFYCPLGTVSPRRCPAGTYNPTTGGMNITACQLCEAGFACTTTGLAAPDANCSASYYCPGGQAVTSPPAYICPFGYHCPEGSVAPVTCPSGFASLNRGLSVCQLCPAGYYCDISEKIFNRTTPRPCPTGHFCLEGTSFATQYPCTPGTANFIPGAATNASCLPCPAGNACPNFGTNETNIPNCSAGYYCIAGASTVAPTDNVTGAICPVGSYCPAGSSAPTLCPAGTLGRNTGLTNESSCNACPAGFYCATPGLLNYTGPCDAGFYCPGGQAVPNPPAYLCPGRKVCPEGSVAPVNCPNGYYTEATDSGRATCRLCTAGHFCNLVAQQFPPFSRTFLYIEPTFCPRGYYCLPGTSDPYQYPCQPGYYSNRTSLKLPTECTPCSPGHYCLNNASLTETGLCASGYYCVLQSDNATPDVPFNLPTVGGQCPPGRFCPLGSGGERGRPCPAGTFWGGTGAQNVTVCQSCTPGYYCQSSGNVAATGDGQCAAGFYCPGGSVQAAAPEFICPAGAYCGLGAAAPTPCNGGTYNPTVGQTTCLNCPGYFYCPQNATEPIECLPAHYCPPMTEYPLKCPNGTYAPSNLGLLNSVQQCVICPAGKYCSNGTISGDCAAGYLCEFGNSVPDPTSSTNEARKKGGLCPLGYYCPLGTTIRRSCPNNTFGFQEGLANAGDCSPCAPGFFCPENIIVPIDCPVGSYCPGIADTVNGGSGVIPCPIGTYNPVIRGTDISFCLPCDNGYYCPESGMSSSTVFPTPSGYYSDLGQAEPYSCPGGTYQPLGGGEGSNTSACRPCPSGHFCSPASGFFLRCPEGTFCPEGTAFPFHCPGGSYCPLNASEPIDCPAGFYCPALATFPVQCPLGTFCPARTELPVLCPGGYVSRNSTLNRTDFNGSCQACPPGTWTTNTLYCLPCQAGHVCLGATPTPTPVDRTLDNGYECPLGYYCPTGSFEETACPSGYFNNETRGKTIADCAACPDGFFNPNPASFTCRACGRSSTAVAGSSACSCRGAFRSFQPEDSSCRCQPGYVFYSDGQRLSEEDAEFDCTPIVYDICPPSQVRAAFGRCVDVRSDVICDACPGSAGTVDPQIGLCICDVLPDVELVCNESCRRAARRFSIVNGELCTTLPATGASSCISLDGATVIGRKGCGLPGQTDCEVKTLQVGPAGMSAIFDPDQIIFDLARSNPDATALSSRRAAAQTTSPTLANPIVCLNLGESVFWDVSDPSRAHYPTYQKDNMLNTNPTFDYTEFRLLAERIRAPNLTLSSFMFAFTEPGLYVFADNANQYQITVIRVLSASERCPSDSPYSTMSQTSLVQLGAIRQPPRIEAPDWVLIGVLMAGLFLLVAGIVGGLWHFRRQTWGLVGSALPRYRSLGMEYLSHRMAGRSGTGGSALAESGGIVGAIQGAIYGAGQEGSGLQTGWTSANDQDRMPAPPGSSKPIILRLDTSLAEFDPSEFIAVIAEEAGVLPANVLILSVTEGSTIVRFVISGCENTQDAANLLINRIADQANEVHSKLPILAFDATQDSDLAAGQHPAYVMQSIEDSYWDYERRIDLEGFNVRTLYDKLEDQTIHIVSQLSNQRDDLLLLCDKILVESEALKDMFFKIRVDLDDRSRRERHLLDMRERQIKSGKIDYDLPEDLKLMLTGFLNDFFKNHVMKITSEFEKLSQPHLRKLEEHVTTTTSTTSVIGPDGQPLSPEEVENFIRNQKGNVMNMMGRSSMRSAGMDASVLDEDVIEPTGLTTQLGDDHVNRAATKMMSNLRTTIDPMEFPAELRDGSDIEDDERVLRAKKREVMLNRKLNRLRRAADNIIMPTGLDEENKPLEGVLDADEIARRANERKEWERKCREARKQADHVPEDLQDSSKLGTEERLRRAQLRQVMLYKRLRQLRDGLTAVDIPDSMIPDDSMSAEEKEKIENKRNAYLDKKIVKLRRVRANAMVPLEMMDDSGLDDDTREARMEKAEKHSDNTLRDTSIMPALPSEMESGIADNFKTNRHNAKNEAITRRHNRAATALEECDLPEGLSDRSDLDDGERARRAELRQKEIESQRRGHHHHGATPQQLAADGSSSAAANANNNAAAAADGSKKRDGSKSGKNNQEMRGGDPKQLSAAVAAAMAARAGVAHTIDVPAEFLDDEDLDNEERRNRAAQRNAYLKGRKSKFTDRTPLNEDEEGISVEEKKRRELVNHAFLRGQAAMFGLTPEELRDQAKQSKKEAKSILKQGGEGKQALIDAEEVHKALQMPDEYKGSSIGDLRKRQAFAAGKRAAALLDEPEELGEIDSSMSASELAEMRDQFKRGKDANLLVGMPVHLQGNPVLEEVFELGRDAQRAKAFDDYLDVIREEKGEGHAAALNNMFQRGRLAAGVVAVPEEFSDDPKAVRAFKVGLAGGEIDADASRQEKAAYDKGLAARLKADFMMPDELRDDVPMLTDEEITTRRRLQAAFKTGMRGQAAEQELKRIEDDKNIRSSDKQALKAAFEHGQKSQKQSDDLPEELDAASAAYANLDVAGKARADKQRKAFIMGRQAAHMAAAVTELVPELDGISHTQRTEIKNAFNRGEKAQQKLGAIQEELRDSADMSEPERKRKEGLRHAFAVGRQAVAHSTHNEELQEMVEERELIESLAKNGPARDRDNKLSDGKIDARHGQSSHSGSGVAGELEEDAPPENKEKLQKLQSQMEEESTKMREEHAAALRQLTHRQKVIAHTEMEELEEEITTEAKKNEFEMNEMFEMERNKLSEKQRLKEISAGGKLSAEDRKQMQLEEEELKKSQEKTREQMIEDALKASDEKRARLKQAIRKNAANEKSLLKGIQQDQDQELKRLHEEAERNALQGKQTLDDELAIQKKQLEAKLAAREKRIKAKAQKEKQFMDQNLRETAGIERDDLETRLRQKEAMKIKRAGELAKLGLRTPEELQDDIAQIRREIASERESEEANLQARYKQERLEHEQELHEKVSAEKKDLLNDAQEAVDGLIAKQKEARAKEDADAPKLSAGQQNHVKFVLEQARQREEFKKQMQEQMDEEQRRLAMTDKRVQEAAQREIQRAERERGTKLTPEQRDAILNECAKNAANLESQRSEDEKKQRDEVKARLEEKRRKREADLKKKQLEEMRKQMEEQERIDREKEEALKAKLAENQRQIEISDAAKQEDERLKAEAEARMLELKKKHDEEAREYQSTLEADLERQKHQQEQRSHNEHERRLAEQKKKQQQQLANANTDEERQALLKQFEDENSQLQDALHKEEAHQKEKMDAQLAAKLARKKQLLAARQKREADETADLSDEKRAELMKAAAMEAEQKVVEEVLKKNPGASQEEIAQAIMGDRHRKEMADLVQRQARFKHNEKDKWKNSRDGKIEALTFEIDAQIDKDVLDLPMTPDRDEKAKELRANGKKLIAKRIAILEKELDEEESRLLTDLETTQAEDQFNLKLGHLNEVSAAAGLGSPEEAMAQIQSRLARRAQDEQAKELLAMKEAKEKEAKEAEERLEREKEEFEKKMDEEYQRRRAEQEEEMKRREREFAAKLASDRKAREKKAVDAARASASAGAGDSKEAAELRKKLMSEGSEDESRLRAFMAQEHDRQKLEHDQLLAEKRARLAARRKAASTKAPESSAPAASSSSEQPSSSADQQQQSTTAADSTSAASKPITDKLSQVLETVSATPAPTSQQQQGAQRQQQQQSSAEGTIINQTGSVSGAIGGPINAGALNQWASQVVLQVQSSPLWEKLCKIEKMVEQQGELGIISYYMDAKDKTIKENEGKLVKVDLNSLSTKQYVNYFFGKTAMDALKKNGFQLPPIEIAIASALPKSSATMSAFAHSYVYDDSKHKIYIRDTRLATFGEFSVILTHALAHILACKKNDTPVLSGWNDADPAFLQEFYPLLEAMTEEMLFTKMANKAKREQQSSEARQGASVVSAETLSEVEKVISKESDAERRENALRAYFHM